MVHIGNSDDDDNSDDRDNGDDNRDGNSDDDDCGGVNYTAKLCT